MTPTVKAILARCDGDKRKAIDYCLTMARATPRLACEYWEILDLLRGTK